MNKNNKEKLLTLKETLNYIAKLVSSAVIVILVIIGILLLVYFIYAKIIAKSAGAVPVVSLYTIVSPSMEPNINVYDIIFDLKVNDPSKIKVGDVITFTSTSNISKGKIVTHRVMAIKKINGKYEYVTKGDNNLSADSDTAKESNLIGKTIFKIPKLGYIQLFILSRLGWIILILLPAIGIIGYDILKMFNLIEVNEKAKDINKNKSLLGYNQNNENKQIEETIERIKKRQNLINNKEKK